MSTVDLELRPFAPGTTGWTADDLDDPEIEKAWNRGQFEIVEGVLTTMPPAFFTGGESLYLLMKVVDHRATALGVDFRFSIEVDIVISRRRVARSDAAMLVEADSLKQEAAARGRGKTDTRRARIYVPPSLIIESMSLGHEDHDREVKSRWYAEFGVPHYWVLDAFRKSLECLRLEGDRYVVDALGRNHDLIRPSLFDDFTIDLRKIWGRDETS